MGVPALSTPSAMLRTSSTERSRPWPRTMNSCSATSSRRPPTSLLLAATASRRPGDGDAVCAQPVGIDGDLVLLDEAADARHFGDARHARQFVLQEPVLQRAQLGKVVAVRFQRVHERPADAGGVGPKRGSNAGRQGGRCLVECFQYAGARPVDVRAILEDDVDERESEERVAAHDFRVGRGKQLRCQRIRDLVLDDARRLAGVLRVDDHLGVGEVRDRIERRSIQGVDADQGGQQRGNDDKGAVGDGPVDDAGEHLPSSFSGGGAPCRRRVRRLPRVGAGRPPL